MSFVPLASGSSGNAFCIECGGGVLLVDCGVSCREIDKRCRAAGVDPSAISWVFFTHAHDDHVRGVRTFHSKHPGAALFASAYTAEAVSEKCGVSQDDFFCFENGQEFDVGPFSVTPFSVPHDAPDCNGFLVRSGRTVYFHATDVGSPLASIGANLALADVATLEFNHDPQLLVRSDRAESLKRRIRGPSGHLSNFEAAELVEKYAGPGLKHVFLAHLSQECNTPELACGELSAALARAGLPGVTYSALAR